MADPGRRARLRRSAVAAGLTIVLSGTVGVAAEARSTERPGELPTSVANADAGTARIAGETDRERAQSLFYDRLLPLTTVPVGWTGSVSGCRVGAPSAAGRQAALQAVNLFREMQGLRAVGLDSTFDAKAQAAALMMQAQGQLSHSPPASWACYTSEGADGAGHSNLYLGVTGADAIWGYMTDPGASNTAVGHRRWIIEPRSTAVGIGMTSGAHALYVVGGQPQPTWTPGGGFAYENPPSTPDWMPWPTAGHFPAHLEPGGRWSLSASDRTTDFGRATVRMTGPHGPVSVTVNPPVKGYGPNTLVWEVAKLPPEESMTADATYQVTVDGITRNGAAIDAVTYPVTLTMPRPTPVNSAPTLTGRAEPGGDLTVRIAGIRDDMATDVTWLRDGKAIATGHGDTYVPRKEDLGKRISARVEVTSDYHATTTLETAAVRITAPRLRMKTTPTLRGSARVGNTLTVRPGVWTPAPDRTSYQWYRGSAAIKGANKATYTLTRADRGKDVRALVSVRRAGYTSASHNTAHVRVR